MKQYDAVIIGFGKAGKTLAAELAAHDWSVAMVERSDKMYGGTCINIGCIPTKALIHSAGLAAAGHPLTFGQRRDYYRDSVASKTALVDLLRDKNYHKLADNARIDVYTGEGSFASPEAVAVKTARGTQQIGGKYIIINTGAETVIPPIEGIAQSRRVYTSTSIMELEELPQHLVIVGGGYIGLEFASMYASFGSKVTVLEGFAELIPREDRDIAAAVREALEKKGIEFRMGARVESVSDTAEGVTVAVADTQTGRKYEIVGDAVLLATGRRPATAGLNLAAAGIETDDRGAVRVDAHLRTTAPHVFAAGDVTGGLQFTYVSLDDFRIIRDVLLGDGARTTANRGPVPYSVFIEPTLSHVGMHEEEARKAGRDIRVIRIAVAAFPRSRILGSTEGVLKAVIDAKTDEILGCTLFGAESGEVINTVATAMKHGVTAHDLRGTGMGLRRASPGKYPGKGQGKVRGRLRRESHGESHGGGRGNTPVTPARKDSRNAPASPQPYDRRRATFPSPPPRSGSSGKHPAGCGRPPRAYTTPPARSPLRAGAQAGHRTPCEARTSGCVSTPSDRSWGNNRHAAYRTGVAPPRRGHPSPPRSRGPRTPRSARRIRGAPWVSPSGRCGGSSAIGRNR